MAVCMLVFAVFVLLNEHIYIYFSVVLTPLYLLVDYANKGVLFFQLLFPYLGILV